MKASALSYYFYSIPDLFRIKNFWKIPLLFIRHPLLFTLDNGLKFYLDGIMDVWTIKEIIFNRHYEVKRSVHSGDIVLDIGAAFGDFSIYSAKKAKMVFAYEPLKTRISLMKRNISLNNIGNIIFQEKAAESLDSVFAENRINKCHFLKIDCEGYEYQILNNASPETLKKIDYIAMEIHLFDEKMKIDFLKLKQKLKDSNFQLHELNNPVHNYLKFLFAYK